jgi:hypothetical protein
MLTTGELPTLHSEIAAEKIGLLETIMHKKQQAQGRSSMATGEKAVSEYMTSTFCRCLSLAVPRRIWRY